MRYDAIVIGAGIGGCAAGCVLAGAGKKVLVLERMGRTGGRCSSEEKFGYKMDLGGHIIIRCEYGPIEEALRRVGKGGVVKFRHLKKLMLKHSGLEVKMGVKMGSKEINNLIFSIIPPEIFTAVSQIMPLASGMMSGIVKQYDDMSIGEMLKKYVKSEQIQDLADLIQFVLFGMPYSLTPAGELLRIALDSTSGLLGSATERELSIGYPLGGLISIPEAMCEGIREKGGEVRLDVDVKKIIIEDERVAGVESADGEVINAPVVISNGGIKETVNDLVGEQYFESGYVDRINGLISGFAPWCLRAALDSSITDIEVALNVPVGNLEEQFSQMWYKRRIPEGMPAHMVISPSNMDPELAPCGKQSLIAYGPVAYNTDDSLDKLEEFALKALEDTFPGFTAHLMWHDFLTPADYAVFGEKEASIIGIAQTFNQVGDKRPSTVSPMEGLYFVGGEAGRDISGVGVELCARSGIACADYIVRTVFQKLGDGGAG
ncbi:MAG: NAD(P)/FAD-dependent oxidoreductase [Actinobacteria bacterium]|nr:NAD(P)/FAD-dependent oxidoreductase [Actinomycetota bacterium]